MGGSQWEQELNFDWLTPQMAVGGRFPIEAAEHLVSQLGIRYVVDLRVEDCDDEHLLREHGITLLHLPTHDLRAVSLPMLRDGVQWVTKHLSRGHKVYIHCAHGVGRSAMLALCVLVAQGDSPLEALTRAKRARWQVSPSPEQLEAFLTWAEDWRAKYRLSWELPTFNALAEIAYSHLRRPPPSEE
ncbi:protein-tyrosine phosphatase family protein [Hyalangium versicolor]|uniref:protein-tyrosine phosphatase family protein n=1 Tax=Hyalangium versicolor TaxID=2861190 RepID=UPI001CCBA33E|nr:dual specificity protein phosphatase family protein [Hyalangium versicolor]